MLHKLGYINHVCWFNHWDPVSEPLKTTQQFVRTSMVFQNVDMLKLNWKDMRKGSKLLDEFHCIIQKWWQKVVSEITASNKVKFNRQIENLAKVAFYYGGTIVNTYNMNPTFFLACEAPFTVSFYFIILIKL